VNFVSIHNMIRLFMTEITSNRNLKYSLIEYNMYYIIPKYYEVIEFFKSFPLLMFRNSWYLNEKNKQILCALNLLNYQTI
jgi:hypothetical protein